MFLQPKVFFVLLFHYKIMHHLHGNYCTGKSVGLSWWTQEFSDIVHYVYIVCSRLGFIHIVLHLNSLVTCLIKNTAKCTVIAYKYCYSNGLDFRP